MSIELEQQNKFFKENCAVERETLKKSVSIIIPSYNRKNLLQKNLEAINSQKYKDYLEIIVVDDGSTDGTLQMLENKAAIENKFIFKYFSTLHAGPAKARNLGITHAKGDILIFLDDDSVIQNDSYIQKLVESFKEENVGIVAGRTLDFYPGVLKLIRAGDSPEVDFDNPSRLKAVVGVPTKNAAFLREAVSKAGGFNPIFKYAYGEDVDLCIRISTFGYKLAFCSEALVYHYPTYSFKGYIKKSYCNGFSKGIFRSIHPDKYFKLSLLKIIFFPLLSVRIFARKTKECFSKRLFSKSIFKELILMYILISASCCAIYLGEINYLLKRNFAFIKIILKATKSLTKYFIQLIKYCIKATFPPYRITFITYLTNKCNMLCQHCFFSASINKNIQEPSLEDIGKMAENYFRYTKTRKVLAGNISQGFTGGEPFVRKDLLDIAMLYNKAGVKHFQINTNGLLTDKIIDFSKELLRKNIAFKFAISIDGLEQTHNNIRNMPGAFQKTTQTIKRLKEMGVDLGIIMTINRLNYKEVSEVVRYFKNTFDIETGLQLIRGANQSNAPEKFKDFAEPLEGDIYITNEIIPEIRGILYKTYLEKSIENPSQVVEYARKNTYLQCHLDTLESRKRLFTCNAGKSVGVVYQNLNVALCEFYKPVGNLREVNFDLPRLWNSPLAQEQRDFVKKCFCTHDCFINVEYNPRFAQNLMSNLQKYLTNIHENIKIN